MTNQVLPDERERFESFCRERWQGVRKAFTLLPNGEYEMGTVEFAFQAYKAALRQSPASLSNSAESEKQADLSLTMANGLTKEETSASASVAGLRNPAKLHGVKLFKEYLADCDAHAIEPDAAGAFNWLYERLKGQIAPADEPTDPSLSVVQLAEQILSDCGCSSDYRPLVGRVAGRIESHFAASHTPIAGEPTARPDVDKSQKTSWLDETGSGAT